MHCQPSNGYHPASYPYSAGMYRNQCGGNGNPGGRREGRERPVSFHAGVDHSFQTSSYRTEAENFNQQYAPPYSTNSDFEIPNQTRKQESEIEMIQAEIEMFERKLKELRCQDADTISPQQKQLMQDLQSEMKFLLQRREKEPETMSI